MVDASSLVLIVTLFTGCNYVLSCQLKLVGLSPIFTKDFGSKVIVFKTPQEYLTLEDGESIKANCRGMTVTASRTANPSYEYNEQVMTSEYDAAIFSCDSDQIVILDTSYPRVQVSCPSNDPLSLYESSNKLPKCTQFENYAIGLKLGETVDVIKAGVCYDLDNLEVKFASYIAYEKKVLVYNKLHTFNELSVNLKQRLNGFNQYFDFLASDPDIQPLTKSPFNIHEFQLNSLIQDEQPELNDFKYIFNIVWWRQLRQENWRFFLNALNERSQTKRYIVHVGTFGNITIPTAQGDCTSSRNEVVLVGQGDMVIKPPGYIWAYLKSITPGVGEEFVVIGHNSPYKMDPDHSEFCEVDICDDFEWLKSSQFGNLRHLSSLGYTFCCRPEDVADKIDYFPFIANDSILPE